MPVELKGSCHCGAVKFTVQSSSAVPYQLCHCSICRKVGGYGGSVNLGGFSDTLKIEGAEHITKYHAVLNRGTKKESRASSERNFCSKCSTMLWLYDEAWPELIHPFASAIDSPLKEPLEMTCVLLDSKPKWVRLPEGPKKLYKHYGDHSLEEWHKTHGEWVE
ncbi:Mss4-like protein [Vararia minispora EC-137]|uniref:Mss4-like protein n=1 Tax=Vararia minispora EC-137 TaxID=1314806 RepID=A0ACB8Q5H6_9AGAM|nr:Mss4-like protein [Vararia minispora EC-137]